MNRRCQILTDGQYWRDSRMSDLVEGSVFRLFELDGREVKDEDGHARWRATAPALLDPEADQWKVEAEAIPESDVERTVRTTGWFFPTLFRSRLR